MKIKKLKTSKMLFQNKNNLKNKISMRIPKKNNNNQKKNKKQ